MNTQFIHSQNTLKPVFKSFEIFKGVKDESGLIKKERVLGQARICEGAKTYHLFIKTFLDIKFYILPEMKNPQKYEYVIFTREENKTGERKYHWNAVGEGHVLMGQNKGLVKLKWDFFDADNIYMNLQS